MSNSYYANFGESGRETWEYVIVHREGWKEGENGARGGRSSSMEVRLVGGGREIKDQI